MRGRDEGVHLGWLRYRCNCPSLNRSCVLPVSLLLAPLWQNRMRLLVAVLAIALGVALGYSIQLINRAAVG
jgi:hypothetical protein